MSETLSDKQGSARGSRRGGVGRRGFLASAVGAAAMGARAGRAQPKSEPIRIGVLGDQTSVYAAPTGPGSVLAARLAIEDVGGRVLGRRVELLVGDHQNKPDLGAGIAREWLDHGVVAIT